MKYKSGEDESVRQLTTCDTFSLGESGALIHEQLDYLPAYKVIS